MNDPGRDAIRKLIQQNAGYALSQPGVLALEPGYRMRGGQLVPDRQVVRAIVARKVEPGLLSSEEDLGNLFGKEHVDVVEATPLKTIFAKPEEFGLDAEALAELEDRVGYPFLPDAVGVRPREFRVLAGARRGNTTYKPPPDVALEDVEGEIKLTCHAGPDAGWKVLRNFLLGAEQELVVGMYDLTAPHIGDALANEVSSDVEKFLLTLDKKVSIGSGTKKLDRTETAHIGMFTEAFGAGFKHEFAHTGSNSTFFSDYHIKLAVADRKAFWLSSGSWQSSNQPYLDPLGSDKGDPRLGLYNREWHVVGEHKGISEVWAKFLEWDFKTAKKVDVRGLVGLSRSMAEGPFVFVRAQRDAFPYEEFWEPQEFTIMAGKDARVVPLLTPDNYIEELIELVEGSQDELLVQNQSLTFLKDEANQDPRYTRFTKALAAKSHDLKEFKLIIRDPSEFGGSVDEALNGYLAKGFDTGKIRFQINCHNKGVIADRSRVLIGSHNFTNAGTTVNRDASLLVENKGIAEYFRDIFEHDWRVAGQQAAMAAIGPQPLMRLAAAGELPPPGMTRHSLWDLLDAD